jgi:protein SCO1/2
MKNLRTLLLAALALACLGAARAEASAQARGPRQAEGFEVPDVEVLDQTGRPRRFYTELVRGKLVIINFVYTTCKAVCPMSGDNFRRLQTLLGERLGRDVHLVSVSTDPEADTPARLRAWGERFRAREGWTMVTGEKRAMTDLLRALTGDGANTGYHVPAVCIIDDRRGTRTWAYGLEAPEQLLKLADDLGTPPGAPKGRK